MNKIVIDCEKMRHPNTGFYYFCKNLALHVIEEAKDIVPNVEINLYLPKKEIASFEGLTHIIPFNNLHKFYLNIGHNSVWHSTTQMSNYWPSNKEKKTILTIHDLNILYEKETNIDRIKKKLNKIQKKIDRADQIVTISNYVKDDIVNNLNLRNKNITVIYNGCNVYKKPIVKPTSNLYINAPFLFAIGAINETKNFHVLPKLLKFNDYVLVLSGEAVSQDYKQKIIEEAIKYNALDRVIFTGPINDNDKFWYFQNCSAFLFPSIAEGFGLPVLEAMHFGKPVFLAKKTSLPEVGGDVAFYFDNFEDEHMQEVFKIGMAEYENTPILSTKLINQSKKFDWKIAAQQYLALYKSLL